MSSGITKLIQKYNEDNDFKALTKVSDKFNKQEKKLFSLLGATAYIEYLKLREIGVELVDLRIQDALIYAYRAGKENRFKAEE